MLGEISQRHGNDDAVAVALTVMILHGLSDEEILTDLGGEILVWDGQRNPLTEVEALLGDLRRTVAEN